MLNYTDQIYLNCEILQTEIWNMSSEILLKDEIWTLIFLSLKVCCSLPIPQFNWFSNIHKNFHYCIEVFAWGFELFSQDFSHNE